MTPTPATRPAPASPRTEAMRKGRQADSARRRQRVIATLNRAAADGTEITVAGIARAASVDRAFLYRHRDLLGKIHALEAALPPASGPPARPSPAPRCKPTCSPPTNAQSGSPPASGSSKNASEALGGILARSGLGAPADTDALSQKVTHLEQQAIDLRLQLEERDQDLAAARAANRELMAHLNATPRHA